MSRLPLAALRTDSADAPIGAEEPRRRVLPRRAAAALLLAAVAGLLVGILAVPVTGEPLEVPAAGRTVGPASILVSSLGAGAAAWILLAVLARSRHGAAVWTGIGLAVLLLSLAGPPLSGATGTVLLVLELMHLVVGGILLVGLRLALARRTVDAEVP